MGQVTVTINSRQFRMACEDGQEEHLAALANELDARIAELRKKFGEIGDTRLTIMAALTIADELLDHGKKLARFEAEIAALKAAGASADDRSQSVQVEVIAAFNRAAERIESIAKRLNQAGTENHIALG